MNDLTHSGFGAGAPPTMTSREIAELTGSTHDNVLKTIRALVAKGVVSENETPYVHPQNGQTYKEFSLGYRDTMVVVSGYSVELRAKIIDRWQQLEARPAMDPAQVLNDPAAMRSLLLSYTEKVLALEAKVEADTPKVAFADDVAAAPDAISLGQAAKVLNTGRNRLCAWLRQIGWLTRLNEPYQWSINSGLMDVKIGSWEHPDKGLQRSVTALVTGKGLAKLHRMLGGAQPTAH